MPIHRKIGFYSIRLFGFNDEGSVDPSRLKEVIKFVQSKKKKERKIDLRDSQFYFLDTVDESPSNQNIQIWIFKHAEYGRRPPLVNKDSLEERENPKEIEEGEREKTHLGVRYDQDEILILLEETKMGVSITKVVEYLTDFCKILEERTIHKIMYAAIAKDDFLKELRKLKRVHAGYISISKKFLGSEFLDLSDRTDEIQKDVVIEVKAKRQFSAFKTIVDVFDKLTTGSQEISKIRVYGSDAEKNPIVLNTDFIKKIQYLELEKNLLTGEINSKEIIDKFEKILMSFHDNG